MHIRKMKPDDIGRIREIFDQAICEKCKIAYLNPLTSDEMSHWFEDHVAEESPAYVAEIARTVAGFAYIDPYRPGRAALKQTAEISYFVDRDYRRRGVATSLISHTEGECVKLGIKTLFAIIIDNNIDSIRLTEKCGYEKWGHLPEVAVFDDLEVGHLYYGKRIAR
ncbi:MAG: GNAT family N-acetyltransferase [Clostridiales Family XIII bacterium]|jgi:phosphinothricin acetyltransferase|nr:GNAT family N-acetyltransferase [Clostridiales Family XIII bacterium]